MQSLESLVTLPQFTVSSQSLALEFQCHDTMLDIGEAGCRYAALLMPLNVVPALACLLLVRQGCSATTVLNGAWAALCSIMAMRALTSYVPFALRRGMFESLPRSKHGKQ